MPTCENPKFLNRTDSTRVSFVFTVFKFVRMYFCLYFLNTHTYWTCFQDDWSSDGSSRSWSRSPAAQSPDGGKGKKKKRHGGHKSSGKKSKKNNKKREAPAKWTSSEESESDYGRRSRSPLSGTLSFATST